MKKTSYIGKGKEELVKTLNEKREAIQAFRFGMAGSRTKDVKAGAKFRKEIARIMTELNGSTKLTTGK